MKKTSKCAVHAAGLCGVDQTTERAKRSAARLAERGRETHKTVAPSANNSDNIVSAVGSDSTTRVTTPILKPGDYIFFENQDPLFKATMAALIIEINDDGLLLNRPTECIFFHTFGVFTGIHVCQNLQDCTSHTWGKSCICREKKFVPLNGYKQIHGKTSWVVTSSKCYILYV